MSTGYLYATFTASTLWNVNMFLEIFVIFRNSSVISENKAKLCLHKFGDVIRYELSANQ